MLQRAVLLAMDTTKPCCERRPDVLAKLASEKTTILMVVILSGWKVRKCSVVLRRWWMVLSKALNSAFVIRVVPGVIWWTFAHTSCFECTPMYCAISRCEVKVFWSVGISTWLTLSPCVMLIVPFACVRLLPLKDVGVEDKAVHGFVLNIFNYSSSWCKNRESPNTRL